MYKNSNRGKTTTFVLFLLHLFFLGGVAHGANAPGWKSETLALESAGEASVPLRIAPVLVEAQRRVDLSWPLTGLLVDLYEYPVLKFSNTGQVSGPYGLELGLDTQGSGAVDTLVRVGDPVLFPDMIAERSDFRSAELVAKDLGYKIKRALGLSGDEKWRYTATKSRVNSITNGVVSASYESGGDLVLQRTFASLAATAEVSKTPWLSYEYELPEGLRWIIEINARIDRGVFSPKLTIFSSKSVMGGGRQKFLVNLYDLLQKAYPEVKDGRLSELIIHFRLDETLSEAAQNVRIDLGKLEFYQEQMLTTNGTEVLLVAHEGGDANINLLKALDTRLSSKNKLSVLGGRLVSAQAVLANKAAGLPRISLLTEYREEIPELFVGDRFFLGELSGTELDAVLDQKIFYKKRLLWESGQSDVIFRKLDGSTLPMLSFSPNITLNGDSYINLDFLFEDGEQYPLRLTLFGIDVHGKPIKQDYQISANKLIRLKSIRIIKKATLSFWQEAGAKIGAKIPFPASFLIKNIQVSSFNKTASYHPEPALAYAALVPASKQIWRAAPARIDIGVLGRGNIQTVQTFSVKEKIIGDAVIKYELETTASENVTYYLRVLAIERGLYLEKIIPLNGRGEVPISNLYLKSLEIIVKAGAPLPTFLGLKQFEIKYRSAEATSQNELLQQKYFEHAEITYFAPHKSLYAPTLAWLRPAYAVETGKSDLTGLHKLDATLSYAQIIGGGKNVVLPKKFLKQGGHELNYVADEGVRVSIDQSFLKLNRDQRNQQAAAYLKTGAPTPAPSKLAKLGLLILVGGLVWLLGFRLRPRWMPYVDRVLSWNPAFLFFQFVLLASALLFYMMLNNAGMEASSWSGLLLVFAYGLAVHYKIRPYLSKKLAFFSERLSAPYFLLFLALLLFCAFMLMLKLNTAAENTAVIGYYLLLTGVAIEFISFAKEARLEATAALPNEKPTNEKDRSTQKEII